MKIRIKFSKEGNMRFIGHLDVMRYFQKAMRRADIDIAYSGGFSPHQIMSFALPLSVGITSEGEYLDIEAHSTRSTKDSLAALNAVMAEGFAVQDYRRLADDAKTAMSIVSCASYRLTFRRGYECPLPLQALREGLHAFYEVPDEIPVTKKTKKSEKIIDLKQLVYDFQVSDGNGTDALPEIYVKLSAGSKENLKPELVMEQFYRFLGLDLKDFTFQIHRLDVYAGDKEQGFLSLNDMGVVIL